jgi:hypothetical protein
MQTLNKDDILGREEYLEHRDEIRRRIMAQKAYRRVPLGERCTVHFESRDTMRYQVLEMLRAENSWDRPGAVEEELEAYAPLVPGGGAVSATLMFEFPEGEERARMLAALVGVHEHLWLEIDDGPRVRAEFDPLGLDPDKVSSVQYVRWQLEAEQIRQLSVEGTVVRLVMDHSAYPARSVLSEQTREALADDAL